MPESSTILAARIAGHLALDARHSARQWEHAEPIRFSADWQGKNADPALETEVRVLWSLEMLYLRFVCHYRELFVFEDSDPNGRRDHLWDRDVAEAFLQPPDSGASVGGGEDAHATPSLQSLAQGRLRASKFYKEFEVAPNGMWIDLDIFPAGLADLKSGLSRSVYVDEAKKAWTAELAMPMKSLTQHFDPAEPWRANFYRVEGKTEPRRYMAWQATNTADPNFHVPEKFGTLTFTT